MKLSALQQSPNTIIDALQKASGTMVADVTSIPDPLPQVPVFSQAATVGASVATELTVTNADAFDLSGIYLFAYAGPTYCEFIVDSVAGNVLTVTWTGVAPALATVGTASNERLFTCVLNADPGPPAIDAFTTTTSAGLLGLISTSVVGVPRVGVAYITLGNVVAVAWQTGANVTVGQEIVVNRVGSGTKLADSYRLLTGQSLLVNAMQTGVGNDSFIHFTCNVSASSLIDVQALALTVVLNKPGISLFSQEPIPVSLLAIHNNGNSYDVEFVAYFTPDQLGYSKILTEEGLSTFVSMTYSGTNPLYVNNVTAFSRNDAGVTIPTPWDYVLKPLAPTLQLLATTADTGLYFSDDWATLTNGYPSSLVSVEYSASSDGTFSDASFTGFAEVFSSVPNSPYLRSVDLDSFFGLAGPLSGTNHIRARVVNSVGIASDWATPVVVSVTPNTPRIKAYVSSVDFANGTINIQANDADGLVRTDPLSFWVQLYQNVDANNSEDEATPLGSVFVTLPNGQTSTTIYIAEAVSYYELDSGIVIGATPIYTTFSQSGSTYAVLPLEEYVDISKDWQRPQKYVPTSAYYAYGPNESPTTESAAALTGTITEDQTGRQWFKSFYTGAWEPIGPSRQRKIDVGGTAITIDMMVHHNATLVFDTASAVTITLPLAADGTNGMFEGFTFNFRNKHATPGAITVVTTGSDLLAGAGATTAAPEKVSSCYLESRGPEPMGQSTWVTVGDMIP